MESTPEAETEFEFSDVSNLMCLLCARQFKTIDVLKRHNKESDLHKKNFKDANLREIARQKVAARKTASAAEQAAEQPKYRDRASERRTLFNQPDAPMPEKDNSSHLPKKRAAEAPRAPTPPPAAPAPPAQDTSNVGNKLLKMMGWKEGAGLGQEGEGRVNPMYATMFFPPWGPFIDELLSETAVYTPGAGLGAAKAKDIAKYAESFTSYAAMAQDSVCVLLHKCFTNLTISCRRENGITVDSVNRASYILFHLVTPMFACFPDSNFMLHLMNFHLSKLGIF